MPSPITKSNADPQNKVPLGTGAVDSVIISEMDGEDGLYSLHFTGKADEFGFSDESDYLSAEDALEIAEEVASETGSHIVWEGYKPAWG